MPPHILARDLNGSLPVQFRVWPAVVVIVLPGIDHVAGVSRQQHRCPRARRRVGATATADLQVLAQNLSQHLVAGRHRLTHQQITQSAIPEPAALCHQLTQARRQGRIINSRRLIPDHPAAHADKTARTTFAQTVMLTGMGDGLPLRAWRYHFSMPDPSAPVCRASPPQDASSVSHSRPRAPSNAALRIPPNFSLQL